MLALVLFFTFGAKIEHGRKRTRQLIEAFCSTSLVVGNKGTFELKELAMSEILGMTIWRRFIGERENVISPFFR